LLLLFLQSVALTLDIQHFKKASSTLSLNIDKKF
jgi:hypothetical protein